MEYCKWTGKGKNGMFTDPANWEGGEVPQSSDQILVEPMAEGTSFFFSENEISKCETCEGTGRVEVTNTVTVDRGTKWQRSDDEMVEIECPECNGEAK